MMKVTASPLPLSMPVGDLCDAALPDAVTGQLAVAVELRCGGKAVLNHTTEVRLDFPDGKVWEGTVYVFDLRDHPTLWRAYAWPTANQRGEAKRAHVVLHLCSVTSPKEAARRTLGGH